MDTVVKVDQSCIAFIHYFINVFMNWICFSFDTYAHNISPRSTINIIWIVIGCVLFIRHYNKGTLPIIHGMSINCGIHCGGGFLQVIFLKILNWKCRLKCWALTSCNCHILVLNPIGGDVKFTNVFCPKVLRWGRIT
jgi:hypothetical protein